jgi:methionyl-tRNA formyltransferase
VRVVYCGSPADAVPPLRALHDAGHDLALVVTQPDARRGRGSDVSPSPVKEAATRLGLAVRTPARAREVVDEIRALDADAGVVVAFGQLLPPELLDATRHGFVNLHYSLLPRWRGAAPVERAILAGDAETGVCVMQLEEGLDTGPVYATARTAIGPDETAGELRTRLGTLGTSLLVDTLPDVGTVAPAPQAGEPTYAEKLSVDEFRIDPARPAAELARLVRAGNPRPGAWATTGGHRLKVLRAHVEDGDAPVGSIDGDARLGTTDGVLALDEVQPEGRAVMSGHAWRAGLRDSAPALDAP